MIRLSRAPFDPGAELGAFSADRTQAGAIVSFLGLARGEAAGAEILELEAYEGFTEAAISEALERARARFSLLDAAVIHHVGKISVGEPIVLVLTAAAHRREAFEACDFLMDYLKSEAPFWKKEFGPDGHRWVEPTPRDLSDLARWG
jgi:molybdopterin synthase catalytic subunit